MACLEGRGGERRGFNSNSFECHYSDSTYKSFHNFRNFTLESFRHFASFHLHFTKGFDEPELVLEDGFFFEGEEEGMFENRAGEFLKEFIVLRDTRGVLILTY